MNFKEEYTELQNGIVPDAAFLEQLARKMDREKKRRRKQRMIFISAAALCTSAAALIVIISLPKPEPIPVKTNNYKFSYTVGLFVNKENLSADGSVSEQLAQLLSENGTTLYKSSENKFDKNDILDENQRTALAEKIKNAVETESELGKHVDHYMMVLESGDVFKFRISGNILEINDKFFKIP